jgi:HSP90 family molecular chaperone
MVADEVRCAPAAGSDECTRWTSRARTASPSSRREGLGRGTEIILHLNEIEGVRRRLPAAQHRARYSDHIGVPVRMAGPAPADAEESRAASRVRDGQRGQGAVDAAAYEISDEEYQEFYKHVSHDFRRPADLEPQQGRGQARVHEPAVRAEAGALRPVEPRRRPGPQALRAAGLHHGSRPSSSCRSTCASSRAWWTAATCR